jgi:hypothetical protein
VWQHAGSGKPGPRQRASGKCARRSFCRENDTDDSGLAAIKSAFRRAQKKRQDAGPIHPRPLPASAPVATPGSKASTSGLSRPAVLADHAWIVWKTENPSLSYEEFVDDSCKQYTGSMRYDELLESLFALREEMTGPPLRAGDPDLRWLREHYLLAMENHLLGCMDAIDAGRAAETSGHAPDEVRKESGMVPGPATRQALVDQDPDPASEAPR